MTANVLKSTMLALALLVTASCAHQPQQATSQLSTSSSAENKQQIVDVLNHYQQAMRNADIAGISATLHDDVVTTFQGKLTTRGKAAVLEGYQSTFQAMDFAEIESTDITITPHHWSEDDPHRASAYLKTAYIRVIQDELDAKYLDDGPDGEEELEVEMHL